MLVLPSTRMLVLELSFSIDLASPCLSCHQQRMLGLVRLFSIDWLIHAGPFFFFLLFLFYIFCFSFFPTPLLTSDEHSAYVLLRPKFSDTGEKLLAGSSNIHLCSFKSAEFWLFFSPYIISGLGSDIAPPRSPLRLTTAARMVHLSRRPRLPDFLPETLKLL